ncbi:MAG: hypothetical protein CSA07_04945 [Bacteroidia bacterium]|nr:MAG: hypothetical protein CSA07_04945 [Bacteroidia bacterium]
MVHCAALLLFLAVSYVYFAPLLEGKAVRQHDRDQWRGTAEQLIRYADTHDGEQSGWTTTLFGGMPSVLVSLQYPMNVISAMDEFLLLQMGARPASYIFLTMAGFYLLLLVLGVNPWLAIAGALGYGLSTYFFIIIGAGHNAKSHALAYLAPLLVGVVLAYRGRYAWGGVLFALFFALSLVAGHVQISYYGGFVVAAMGLGYLVEAVRGRTLRRFAIASGVLVLGMLFGVGANFNRLYHTWDYGKSSIRGASELTQAAGEKTGGLDRSYATSWSYGKAETLNLFVPNFAGGASSLELDDDSQVGEFLKRAGLRAGDRANVLRSLPVYWGPQPMTSGPVYVGAVMVLLFVLALILVRGPLKWALLSVTGLSVLLAWGKNFGLLTDLFFDFVPGYNKFRTVSMILVIAELGIPLLALLGLQEWFGGGHPQPRLRRALFCSLGIVAGGALTIALLGPSIGDFSSAYDAELIRAGYPQELIRALEGDRASLMRMDALRSLVFVLATGLLLGLNLRGKLTVLPFGLLLAAVVVVDMWPVNKRYDGVSYEPKSHLSTPYPMTPADRAILRDTSYYRVYNTTVSPFNDASTSYYHNSIGGYHGAKLRIFQDFVDRYGGRELMLNLMNVKYIIGRGADGQYQVSQNREAFGAAWFVERVVPVETADEELAQLGEVDLRRVALVRRGQPSPKSGEEHDVAGSIRLVAHEANRMVYESSSASGGFGVFSEVWYRKGWRATIDGQEVPIVRTDYLLRGLEIPKGTHRVEFSFSLPLFAMGQYVDLIFGLAIIGGFLLLLGLELRRKRGGGEANAKEIVHE